MERRTIFHHRVDQVLEELIRHVYKHYEHTYLNVTDLRVCDLLDVKCEVIDKHFHS